MKTTTPFNTVWNHKTLLRTLRSMTLFLEGPSPILKWQDDAGAAENGVSNPAFWPLAGTHPALCSLLDENRAATAPPFPMAGGERSAVPEPPLCATCPPPPLLWTALVVLPRHEKTWKKTGHFSVRWSGRDKGFNAFGSGKWSMTRDTVHTTDTTRTDLTCPWRWAPKAHPLEWGSLLSFHCSHDFCQRWLRDLKNASDWATPLPNCLDVLDSELAEKILSDNYFPRPHYHDRRHLTCPTPNLCS